jgi:hypothetical protein
MIVAPASFKAFKRTGAGVMRRISANSSSVHRRGQFFAAGLQAQLRSVGRLKQVIPGEMTEADVLNRS